jgi:polysaccharide pyruvyl transferase WcaK-like protein
MIKIRSTAAKALRSLPWLHRAYRHIAFIAEVRKRSAAWPDARFKTIDKGNQETFIFGRYGTETTGNHFIQLGLLRVLFEVCPTRPVHLVSNNTAVTEAGLDGIKALLRHIPGHAALADFVTEKVGVVDEEAMCSLAPGDLLILGGGPIMDDPDLGKWHRWFLRAHRCGAGILIAGCGLSPLRHPKAVALARTLVALADAVVVREKTQIRSISAARKTVHRALDPAFLCAPLLRPLVVQKQRILAVNCRTIGPDSVPNHTITTQRVTQSVANYAAAVGTWTVLEGVLPFSTREGATESDAVSSSLTAHAISQAVGAALLPLPETSVMGMIEALVPCEYLVSTRMHGFIVGLMLGCRSVNLDYIAGGGKGSALYRDWLAREGAPLLLEPRPLQEADFISFFDLDLSIEDHFTIYADAVREALTRVRTC